MRGSQGQSHVQPAKFRRDSLSFDLRVQGGEASPGNATVQHPGVHVPAAQVAARGRDNRNGPGANYRGDAGRPEPVILEIPHWARQIVAQEQMRLLQQVLQPIGAAANQRQVGGKSACNCTCTALRSFSGWICSRCCCLLWWLSSSDSCAGSINQEHSCGFLHCA